MPGEDDSDPASRVARGSEKEISAKLKEQLEDVKERESKLVARQEALEDDV